MPVRLGHWQSQTSNVCSEMTGQWSDRSAMSSHKNCHYQVQWATCAAWHWGLDLILKEKALLWNTPCSQDSLWHTGWWKAWAWEVQDDTEAADREGLQRTEALSYWPNDRHTWRSNARSGMRASQQPGRGLTDVDVTPCTCILIKNLVMMMM